MFSSKGGVLWPCPLPLAGAILANRDPISVGLIDNMPCAALFGTERHFHEPPPPFPTLGCVSGLLPCWKRLMRAPTPCLAGVAGGCRRECVVGETGRPRYACHVGARERAGRGRAQLQSYRRPERPQRFQEALDPNGGVHPMSGDEVILYQTRSGRRRARPHAATPGFNRIQIATRKRRDYPACVRKSEVSNDR